MRQRLSSYQAGAKYGDFRGAAILFHFLVYLWGGEEGKYLCRSARSWTLTFRLSHLFSAASSINKSGGGIQRPK